MQWSSLDMNKQQWSTKKYSVLLYKEVLWYILKCSSEVQNIIQGSRGKYSTYNYSRSIGECQWLCRRNSPHTLRLETDLKVSCSGYPPWIFKQGELESFGCRIFFLNPKTKRNAFFIHWKDIKKMSTSNFLFWFCDFLQILKTFMYFFMNFLSFF